MKPHLNICPNHWDMVRKRVDDYGLSHLVQNEVGIIIERALDGSYDSTDDFDPLLMMNFQIWKDALQKYGVQYMLTPTDIGDKRCPLCEHALHNGETDEWIDIASTHALLEARRLGFIPSLQ